jgi:hypothetical protein
VTARRGPAAYLRLRVGSRHEVAFVPFPARAPMFVIGAAGTVVSFTLPEQIEAGHVDFARQLAAKAWAYAVAVERRYRGLPQLPDVPAPYTLTAQAEALLDSDAGTERAGLVPLPGGREVTA